MRIHQKERRAEVRWGKGVESSILHIVRAASILPLLYTVTRRSAEFRHPARMTQDSSCYIGENDCFIWAGEFAPSGSEVFRNHRKFPAIFTMKKGRRHRVGSNSVPLDYYSCPLPLDHSYHVLNGKKNALINIKYQRESKKRSI